MNLLWASRGTVRSPRAAGGNLQLQFYLQAHHELPTRYLRKTRKFDRPRVLFSGVVRIVPESRPVCHASPQWTRKEIIQTREKTGPATLSPDEWTVCRARHPSRIEQMPREGG